ncbi:MAG: ribonuclease HII [Microbacteriaceae bacterium]
MSVTEPSRRAELALLRAGARHVIGVDEVGRGAIAGPVAVGVAVVGSRMPAPPAGLRDSKLLSQRRREELQPLLTGWLLAGAVGLASVQEIEALGIVHCLGLAGARALAQLDAALLAEAVVLLDGGHDYLSGHLPAHLPAALRETLPGPPPVHVRVKADRDCTVVAAASVLAKVHRDRLMIAAHEGAPHYGWASNKGYAAAAHYAAIETAGVHPLHRRSWLRRPAERTAVEGDPAADAHRHTLN